MTSGFPRGQTIGGFWIPALVRSLNAAGCDVHILTQNCENRKTEKEDLWPGCSITYFNWRGGNLPLVSILGLGMSGLPLAMQFMMSGIREAVKICREWKPDVLFAEWLVPSGFMAYIVSKRTNIPYAVRALGSDVLKAGQNPLIRPIIRLIAKSSGVLFADGFDLCQKTSALAGGKRCLFAATSRLLDAKRSDFKVPDDKGSFSTCTVGRLQPVKGQDILIEAAALCVKAGVPLRSYIVGDGPEFHRLQEMIREKGLADYVVLTGKLEDGDITDLLRHVDCVIIPSRSESIPLSFGEAIAARKPLIVTNVGDLPYLVEKYGLGYVTPSEDAGALARAIARMSRHPRDEKFSNEKAYQEITDLLSTDGAANVIITAIKEHRQGGAR